MKYVNKTTVNVECMHVKRPSQKRRHNNYKSNKIFVQTLTRTTQNNSWKLKWNEITNHFNLTTMKLQNVKKTHVKQNFENKKE
jgi:hypothetical protein